MSCAFYKFQRVHRLVDVFDGRRDVSHYEGEGVAR